ncbi:MAG: hypothetical protein ACYC6M_03245 [Terriglobales bacterium]
MSTTLAMAASDVVGIWHGSSNDGQNENPFTLTIVRDAGVLKGSIDVADNTYTLDHLVVTDEGKVTFSININGSLYTNEATLEGDTLAGTYSSPDGDGTWKATRGKPADAGSH